ncbi:hypothetical protein VOLCADRAFT_105953 [Volvox carteri f. nagariensis]|uniref:Zinc finger HIT domain-containing protein n=1 Tax=Volvox carteri f. nagariensis TaxID=3068 RepID=D8U4G5_VOLCA|nr:uncharacterized protein VOLCADRAFT_105953 [Volvox carteri f. nagariensis]EFJ45498.1 hypothetical protein VOLCADRAFT_105953 [Volvox carteri f. nagariensis]|eukprot:XP_002953525.1 hypothetical protein VOLCADRAFT_105953 [Volvox carteri f. nagariensis]
MSDKLDLDLDVAHLVNVESEVLTALRVGQRLKVSRLDEGEALFLCTEAGVKLAPLPGAFLAASCVNAKVIIRAIKREAAAGAIHKFQVRMYRGEDAGVLEDGCGSVAAGAGAGTARMGEAASGDAQAGSTADDEQDYKLRRSQYQALADNEELRNMLADPHLRDLLTRIDTAPDRERVLMSLDPTKVPATAATAAAVAMATR